VPTWPRHSNRVFFASTLSRMLAAPFFTVTVRPRPTTTAPPPRWPHRRQRL
jgi:hypothetical protein